MRGISTYPTDGSWSDSQMSLDSAGRQPGTEHETVQTRSEQMGKSEAAARRKK
jgi:hypothetical protein